MTVRIPKDVFLGISGWMAFNMIWLQYFQTVLDEHMGPWCDKHDIDTFEQLARQIGPRRVTTLKDHAFMDFLSRDTGWGNVVDLYLAEQAGRENKISKAYLEGCRKSRMGLYKVSDVQPGKSFLAHDLILESAPIRVRDQTATKTLQNGEQSAMRIVKLRGKAILGGDILNLQPDCITTLHNTITKLVTEAMQNIPAGTLDDLPPELTRSIATTMALRECTPLFSQAWLSGSVAQDIR